jgi:hypothetical protein
MGAALLSASAASATSILYTDDYILGTDYMGQALGLPGSDSVTYSTAGVGGYSLSSYNLVIAFYQDNPPPSGDVAALSSYIAGGGKVIFDDYSMAYGDPSPSGMGSYDGNNDINRGITVGSLLSAGISGELSINNPGWDIYDYGLDAASGGSVLATFDNGEAAIVLGNDGNTILNGFLSDVADGPGSQLYTNEINDLLSPSAVPEPASLPLLLAGLSLIGGAMYFGRKKVLAS